MATRKRTKNRGGSATKKPVPKRPASKKAAVKKAAVKKAAVKKAAVKKAAVKKPAVKKPAVKKPAVKKPAVKKPAVKKPAVKKPASEKKATQAQAKKAGKRAPSAASTEAPGSSRKAPSQKSAARGQAPSKPPEGPVDAGRRLLRELTAHVERAGDQDAERILGGGSLEALLAAVLPARKRASQPIHAHLLGHKRRASLMAQVRHAINEAYSFGAGGGYVSPTRVQWFYDGLTFLEGEAPFAGVMGLYREGELRYGLGVEDAAPGTSLGPSHEDFVSVDAAKKSFRAAAAEPTQGLRELLELEAAATDSVEPWVRLLQRHPWMLGAQHAGVSALSQPDADLPAVTAKRVADGCHDVLVIEAPQVPIVGKTGKTLSSFNDAWSRAHRQLTFVQRQAGYLSRELGLKFRAPRALVLMGRGLGPAQREAIRRDREAQDASVRLITYDGLRRLAERTLAFFEPRI